MWYLISKNKLVIAIHLILIGIFGLRVAVHAENRILLTTETNIEKVGAIAFSETGQSVIELEDRAERLRAEVVQKLIKEDVPSRGMIKRDVELVQKKLIDKKKFDENMSFFREARDDFNKNKDDARQKAALLKLVNGLKSRATLLNQRADKLPVINQELQDSISSEALAETAKFQEIELRIQAANNSEMLKALTTELRNRRDVTGQKSRLLILLSYIGVQENYYVKTVKAQIMLVSSGIQKLKADGKDTAALDSLLTQAQAKSVQIQQKISEAKTAIGAEAITDARLRELHGVIQGINNEIAVAYGLLLQIIQAGQKL